MLRDAQRNISRVLVGATLTAVSVMLLADGCSDSSTGPQQQTLDGPVVAYTAVSSTSPGGRSLRLTQADGKRSRALISDTATLFAPAWSPDGAWVAFSVAHATRSEIEVVRPDGTQRARITNGRTWSKTPAWSPDGQRIVFAGGPPAAETLYVMNRDGSNVSARAPSLWSDGEPAWSPDGTMIAFTSLRDPPVGNTRYRRLFLMNTDGSNVHRLAADLDVLQFAPSWSRDGRELAFEAAPLIGGPGNIYILTLATGALRKVLPTDDNYHHPTWSPDGKRIVFSLAPSGGTSHIWSIAVDGTDLRQVTSGATADWEPQYRPTP